MLLLFARMYVYMGAGLVDDDGADETNAIQTRYSAVVAAARILNSLCEMRTECIYINLNEQRSELCARVHFSLLELLL